LDHQDNYVGNSRMMSDAAKNSSNQFKRLT